RTGAKPASLLIGTGSDEVIAMVINAFAQPRTRGAPASILTTTPSFVMYKLTSRAHGVRPVEVPLDAQWDLDMSSMERAIAMMSTSVVWVASPNNPTSNRMSEDRLARLADVTTPKGDGSGAFFVIDEAYVDYAGSSLRTWRARHPHVGILRTLSKI